MKSRHLKISLLAIALGNFCMPANAFDGQKFLSIYAKQSTISIETPSGGGSGIIIGKKGNEYTFLTSSHVIESLSGSESLEIKAQDSDYVNGLIDKDFSDRGIDLAIGTFNLLNEDPNFKLLPVFALADDDLWTKQTRRVKKSLCNAMMTELTEWINAPG